jgi:hypothetical protein
MNNGNSEFMLLFRGEGWDKGLSPEEVQQVMDKVTAWFEGLKARGIMKGARPLERAGKIVSGRGARIVADGPFAESKEAVGGYLIVEVADMAAAVAIAKSCPKIDYGMAVEVRPLMPDLLSTEHIKDAIQNCLDSTPTPTHV